MLPYPEESVIPSSPEIQPRPTAQAPEHDQNLTPEDISTTEAPFKYLKYFDTAFLIDDSDSMLRYWGEVAMLLEEIAGICIEHDRDGIDIYFIHHRPHGSFFTRDYGYKNIGATDGNLAFHDSVAGIFDHVRPRGKCRLDQALERILTDYLDELKTTYAISGRRKWIRPLNLIVITAGQTYDNFYKSLRSCARELDRLGAPPYQVGVQLFQIGNNATVKENMEFAADGLDKESGHRNMVDTTTWSGAPGELSADAILKVILGSVQKSIDKIET